jgi:hypothetical protein
MRSHNVKRPRSVQEGNDTRIRDMETAHAKDVVVSSNWVIVTQTLTAKSPIAVEPLGDVTTTGHEGSQFFSERRVDYVESINVVGVAGLCPSQQTATGGSVI